MRIHLIVVVGATALLAGSVVRAQETAPSVTVTEATTLSGLLCGQTLARSYKVKNAGSASLTSKITLNGKDTAFTLGPGEEKTIVANGGSYSCATTLEYAVSIPSPTAGGAPLFQKAYKPFAVVYSQNNHSLPGATIDVRAMAACGKAVSVAFNSTAGFLPVSVSGTFAGQSFDGSVPSKSSKVFNLQPLNCAAPLATINYKIGSQSGQKLTAGIVKFQ
jgi:hypothetical protein